MWRNYWTVAVRALAKNKTYSIVNIAGLAIGMAACMMIVLYINYEHSYDSWLPDAGDTYQLQSWYPHPKDGDPMFMQMSEYVTEGLIRKDFPQVTGSVYAMMASPVFMKDGQASATDNYLIADGDFLKVVDLPLLRGTTLTGPHTAVVSRQEAVARYGTDRVVGRTLTVISRGKSYDYTITGVLRDVPKNSSLRINALLRADFNSYFGDDPSFLTCWGCHGGFVFLKMKPGTDVNRLQAEEPAWEKRNIPDVFDGTTRTNHGDEEDWHFVNLKDVHLGKAQDDGMAPGNDRRTIATFGIIAALILAMAIVNFMNLTTARAGQRAREVALRKVLGATRRQLIVQFLAEAIVISALAMVVALALAELLLKPFAAFLDADLSLNYLGRGGMLLPAIGLTLLVGMASGLYPAFFLSRFRPAHVLKANQSSVETRGSGRLRVALVVLQFAISIGLMTCTAIIYGQTVYARSVDPGYRRDHILQVDNMSRLQLIPKGEAIAELMKRIPGVVAVGRSDIGVATQNQNNSGVTAPGATRPVTIGKYQVDEGFFDAMGLKLVAGRWFDPNRPMDDMTLAYPPTKDRELAIAQRGANIVINQSAVKLLGFKSPQDAIGKVVKDELFDPALVPMNETIVGVVGDSRFRSVRTSMEPLMFQNVSQGPSELIIRYRGDPRAVEAAVEKQWKQVASDVPFQAQFSEDIMRDLYKSEDARAEIFAAFSILAIIIGCLGLFGLAAFTAERRTKEIGIRKVLGARTRDIVRLLVWQFSRPVIIANIIAWPAAWWVMRDWLNGFDQRIPLTPLPFLLAAVIALAIAVVTVAGHAMKVARANPIHALRYE